MTTTIGERLIHIRGRKSQAAFAAEVGVHKNSLGNYERGERTPDADFLARLAELGFDVHWVLTGEGTPIRPEPTPEPEPAQPQGPKLQGKIVAVALGIAHDCLEEGDWDLDQQTRRELVSVLHQLAYHTLLAYGPDYREEVRQWCLDALKEARKRD